MKDKMTKAEEDELRARPINVFKCDSCKDGKEMEFSEFKEHLISVHAIPVKGLTGKKKMLMHMDGSQWFSSTYEWTLENGFKFHQHVMQARAKDDPMRYED